MKCRRCGATIHISKRKSNFLSIQKSYPEQHMSIECTCYLCDTCLKETNQKFDVLVDFMRGPCGFKDCRDGIKKWLEQEAESK